MDKYKDILKKFGAGSLVSFNESDKTLTRISTGSLSLDKSLGISNEGVGGIPLGKVIEIMGAESSGKSTLCLHVIAEFQKAQDRDVLLIDGEYSFDYNYAKALGVKVEELIVSQPESLEDAYNLALDMVNTGNVALVIIDSHTSLPSRKRLENDIGKDEVALEPRIHSDALRRLKGVLDKNKCSLIGVTQLRDKVGSMFGGSQGTGGNAWKFYSDIRISGWRKTDKKNMEDIVTWSAIKNKTSIPFQEAVVPIGWGIGFDKVLETIDIGVSFDLIVKKGSWYQTPDGTSIGQGKNKVVEFMLDNPEYYQKFYEKVKNELWEEVIKNIPLSHKIPALMHLINMYAEEEEFEVCAIIRKELDKYTIEPPFSRGGMEIFLREHAKNKYLELGYHIDISELKAYRLKKRIDNIRNKGGKIDLIKEILDEYYN